MTEEQKTYTETKDEDINDVPLYRKKRVLIPFVVFILAVAFGAWYWYHNLRNFVSTDDAYVDADRVSISAKVLGRIVQITADEGSAVKKGDVLARLDDTDLRAQMEQAKANLDLALASLPLAKVNVDRATEDYKRADVQIKGAVITQEQYSHAQKTLDAAQAEYAIAQSRVGVAKAQMGVVEAQLQNMILSAPFDGVVARRWLLEGDIVQPGQPIFSIYDIQRVWIAANLEETNLETVKLQNDVEVHVDMYHGRVFRAKVGLIGDYTAAQFSLIPPNNASGNFTKITQRVPLRIYLDGLTPEIRERYPFRPGMSVEVKIRVR
jgi:membrane fusion protein (multidrug efflux system)